MARKPRLEFPGAIYHINQRGNQQQQIYLDDDDRILFLNLLQATIHRMNWVCHAYCLMGNHYHLLIEIPEGILSRGMAWLNGVYTQKFNRKYNISGHLFQGRFKSKPVQDSMQLLMTARYIVRNPVQANIVENADQWPWSSYKATVGINSPPGYLFVDDVLSCLSNDRSMAQLFFQEFVHTEIEHHDDRIIKFFQRVYAEERDSVFSKRIGTVMDMRNSLGPVPRNHRILSRPELMDLFNGNEHGILEKRNRIICDAFKLYAYTQTEIADYLGLDRTTISKIVSKTNQ